MALAVLAGLNPASPGHRELLFLSAGTDGNDGPTDAAGAFASMALADRAKAIGLDPDAYLLADDSYHFFERTDGLLKTGPTGTNVCDLQILLLP
jgi:hydroxypyruvate reductase